MRRRRWTWVEPLIIATLVGILAATVVGAILDYRARRTCVTKGGTVHNLTSDHWKCINLPAEDPR